MEPITGIGKRLTDTCVACRRRRGSKRRSRGASPWSAGMPDTAGGRGLLSCKHEIKSQLRVCAHTMASVKRKSPLGGSGCSGYPPGIVPGMRKRGITPPSGCCLTAIVICVRPGAGAEIPRRVRGQAHHESTRGHDGGGRRVGEYCLVVLLTALLRCRRSPARAGLCVAPTLPVL